MVNIPKLITVVIAANKIEYGRFLSDNHAAFSSQYNYRYVGPESSAVHMLRGYRNIDFICIGNYKQRKDLKEIFDIIEICNIGTELEGKARVYRILYT